MISTMTSILAGVIIVVFLGYYAISINQPPLWIVIVGVLAMALTDFVLTAKDEKRRRAMGRNGHGQQESDGPTG